MSEESTVGIIVPGPEIRPKIENAAASLSKKDSRKAEELMAKVLASPKATEFLFFDKTHVFYPFFLSKLNEFRKFAEAGGKEQGGARDEERGAGGSAAASNVTAGAPVVVGGVVRREGGTALGEAAGGGVDPWRENLLREAEKEARQYLQDPFPAQFSLDLQNGTVFLSAILMDYLTLAAQYVAKYGDPFLAIMQHRLRTNPQFRFLQQHDARHITFKALVASYKVILSSTPEATEDRLERLGDADFVLGTLCGEKTNYARAAMARRKAVLLTDDSLRSKLDWNIFTTIHTFTLEDLGLDRERPPKPEKPERPPAAAPRPATTTTSAAPPPPAPAPTMLGPPNAAPTFTPTFMSTALVQPADSEPPGPARGKGRKQPREDHSMDGAGRAAPRSRTEPS